MDRLRTASSRSATADRLQRQSRGLRVLSSVCAMGVGGVAGVYGFTTPIVVAAVVAMLVACVLLELRARRLLLSKRYRMPDADTALLQDVRAPVLYLRSFDADQSTSRGVGLASWCTEEEAVADAVRDIGPVVGVGVPGETLPVVGAARFFLPEDAWQDGIVDLLPRAGLVVIRMARSAGLMWELEQVFRRLPPERVLLLVPRDEEVYQHLRRWAGPHLSGPLPEQGGWRSRPAAVRALFPARGDLKLAIHFDSSWRPHVVDIGKQPVPFLRRSARNPVAPALRAALQPVFARLGVPWTPPPRGAQPVLLVLVIICLIYSTIDILSWSR